VLKDAQQLNLDSLYQQEPIGTWPPETDSGDEATPSWSNSRRRRPPGV